MNHFILNLSDGDREQAASFLRAGKWTLERDVRHRDALAAGDLVLIHVGRPWCQFVGRARLATAWQDGTALASEARPTEPSSGVWLSDVEAWSRAVPLDAVVRRIDPAASNPQVQANAAGFRWGVVLITAEEHAAVVALSRETR